MLKNRREKILKLLQMRKIVQLLNYDHEKVIFDGLHGMRLGHHSYQRDDGFLDESFHSDCQHNVFTDLVDHKGRMRFLKIVEERGVFLEFYDALLHFLIVVEV